MLVLSRNKDEQLVIGPFSDGTVVVITNVETRGTKVRIGVDAPKHVPVNRREVYDSKAAEGTLPAIAKTKETTDEA